MNAVLRAIDKNSFCTLATVSPDGRPHVTGVLYAAVDGVLYLTTLDTSRKARNIKERPYAAVCIPVRRYPLAPPFAVQFQGTAELVDSEDEELQRLITAGRLKKITGHGVLDEPRTCFVRVTPAGKVSTYGIGVPLRELVRDPLHADRTFELRP